MVDPPASRLNKAIMIPVEESPSFKEIGGCGMKHVYYGWFGNASSLGPRGPVVADRP